MPSYIDDGINHLPNVSFSGGTQLLSFPLKSSEVKDGFSIHYVYEPSIVPSTPKHYMGANNDDWRAFSAHTFDATGGLFIGTVYTKTLPDAEPDESGRIVGSQNEGTYVAGEAAFYPFIYEKEM